MSYSEKLKDPRWQKVRLQVFERDNWECLRCDCDSKTLHAHHIEYETGKDPWDYELWKIVTLCEDCHTSVHNDEYSEQILKEIFPIRGYENDRISEFNRFYYQLCNDHNIPINICHYCRCIRAYFIDTNINFTTEKNTMKRIRNSFYPVLKMADMLSKVYDECYKLLIYSQDCVKLDTFEYVAIEDIIAITIKKISAKDIFMFVYPTEDTWHKEFDNMFFSLVCNIIIDEKIRQKKINFSQKTANIKDFFKLLSDLRKPGNESIRNFDPFYFMWDENKWIECFDSIDYTPPELKDDV